MFTLRSVFNPTRSMPSFVGFFRLFAQWLDEDSCSMLHFMHENRTKQNKTKRKQLFRWDISFFLNTSTHPKEIPQLSKLTSNLFIEKMSRCTKFLREERTICSNGFCEWKIRKKTIACNSHNNLCCDNIDRLSNCFVHSFESLNWAHRTPIMAWIWVIAL